MSSSSLSAGFVARSAVVGTRRIHYVEVGAGPVVLMLHGGGPGASGFSNYSRNIEVLAARFRVVVPDMPGYGRSSKGVNFDALDSQPVSLVMLFLVPQGQFQKHLHTLANIAKLLHKAEFRQALDKAPDADAMLKIIRGQGQK